MYAVPHLQPTPDVAPFETDIWTLTKKLLIIMSASTAVPGGGGITKDILKAGDGKTFPKKGDKLTMHYTGTLQADGTKFDSSVDKGRPFSFTIGVGQVIAGWDKGVMTMSLGEKGILHIPSDQGYGARGAGGVIPPNADLDFEVELLNIGEASGGGCTLL